jgi:hypothetical protein
LRGIRDNSSQESTQTPEESDTSLASEGVDTVNAVETELQDEHILDGHLTEGDKMQDGRPLRHMIGAHLPHDRTTQSEIMEKGAVNELDQDEFTVYCDQIQAEGEDVVEGVSLPPWLCDEEWQESTEFQLQKMCLHVEGEKTTVI